MRGVFMIRTTHLVVGGAVLLCATRSSRSAGPSGATSPPSTSVLEAANSAPIEHRPASVTLDRLASADDERSAASAAWMERSRSLAAGVTIEDLHYARATDADGRAGIAVVGRAVNQGRTALSLLAIHLELTGPSGAIGNVPVIAKPEQLQPGDSKTFEFFIDPARGFTPLRGAPLGQPPVSLDEQRALGRISAYVTYAAE
jgi:hypothetical protein